MLSCQDCWQRVLKQGVCVTLGPCHLHERVFQGKRRIMETQIFHPCKNIINLQQNPLKETKTLHNIVTLLLGNLKFQPQAKIYLLSKILI